MDGAADEEEPKPLACPKRDRRDLRMKAFRIDGQRNDPHAVGRHSAFNITVAHRAAVRPYLVHHSRNRFDPSARQTAVFPWLNENPAARIGRCETWRPEMADVDI